MAALNNKGPLAAFSNFGKERVDISAPGVDVLSSIPATPERSGATLSTVGTGRAVTVGFGVDEILGEGARADFMRRSLEGTGFDLCPEAAPCDRARRVLLVDDDLSTTFAGSRFSDAGALTRAAIEDATEGTPTTIEVVDAGAGDGPDLAAMQAADAVVWSTGWAYFSRSPDSEAVKKTLTFADHNNLTRYLEGDGGLILNSVDALHLAEGSTFVKQTLGLDVERDYGSARYEGAATTGFAGTSYDLLNPRTPCPSTTTSSNRPKPTPRASAASAIPKVT